MRPFQQNIPGRKPRKMTICKCKWCGEEFESERSDTKYCCNSHKTMACDKRREDIETRRLNYERQLRIKQQEKLKQVIPVSAAPTPTKNIAVDNSLIDFEKEMNAKFEKARLNIAIESKKYELERYCRQFSHVAKELLKWADYGSISKRDIRSISWEVNLILGDQGIRRNEKLEDRLAFLEDVLVEYLEELKELEKNCEYHRLDFELPEEVCEGLEMLGKIN